jgi:hypothetical protein
MNEPRDVVHFGVKKIAERIQLGRNTTRKLLQRGVIRGYQAERGCWYCIESELNEDIKKIPKAL